MNLPSLTNLEHDGECVPDAFAVVSDFLVETQTFNLGKNPNLTLSIKPDVSWKESNFALITVNSSKYDGHYTMGIERGEGDEIEYSVAYPKGFNLAPELLFTDYRLQNSDSMDVKTRADVAAFASVVIVAFMLQIVKAEYGIVLMDSVN